MSVNPPTGVYSTLSVQGTYDTPPVNPPDMIYSTLSVQGTGEAPPTPPSIPIATSDIFNLIWLLIVLFILMIIMSMTREKD